MILVLIKLNLESIVNEFHTFFAKFKIMGVVVYKLKLVKISSFSLIFMSCSMKKTGKLS